MKQHNDIILLNEYEEVSSDDLEEIITKKGIRQIEKINKKHKIELFRFLHKKIKATNYVGFLKVNKNIIQVLPKIFEDEYEDNLHFLLQLLNYTNRIKIKENDRGFLKSCKDNFFEIIIYLFSKHLRELLLRDFKKNYVNIEENIVFLKGKLLLKEHINNNLINKAKYYCRHEIFTENNLMNQILKYTCNLLIRISSSNTNKKLLEEILIYLCNVDFVSIKSDDFDKIHFTRLNKKYEYLINMCRLFLEHSSIQFRSEKLETFVFMFDMTKLFEEFVYKFIKTNKSKIFIDDLKIISIDDQHFLGKIFNEFRLYVDILAICDNNRSFLIDTKYKILSDNVKHYGISQSDFYQMFAYSTSQDRIYKEIILIYPYNKKISLDPKIFTHDKCINDNIRIYVKTIDLMKIYNKENKKINKKGMVDELNRVFTLN